MATLTKLTRGETFRLSATVPGAAAVAVRLHGPSTIEVSATNQGGEWSATSATDTWPAGGYVIEVWATMPDASKQIVSRSTFTVRDSGFETSLAAQAVANIEAMLAGTASELVREYQINNRRLANYSVDELLKLLSYWRNRLQAETRRDMNIPALGPRIAVRI